MTHDEFLIQNALNNKIKQGGHQAGTMFMEMKYEAAKCTTDIVQLFRDVEYAKCFALAEIRLAKAELGAP
jgi:hypothetical protein